MQSTSNRQHRVAGQMHENDNQIRKINDDSQTASQNNRPSVANHQTTSPWEHEIKQTPSKPFPTAPAFFFCFSLFVALPPCRCSAGLSVLAVAKGLFFWHEELKRPFALHFNTYVCNWLQEGCCCPDPRGGRLIAWLVCCCGRMFSAR